MLDDEINIILGKLYVDLAILRLKCILVNFINEFFEKQFLMNTIPLKRKENQEYQQKKRTNETEILKEEVKKYEYKSLDSETKIFKLLTDLEYEKNDALHNIVLSESKLIKLEISPERTDRIKSLVLSS